MVEWRGAAGRARSQGGSALGVDAREGSRVAETARLRGRAPDAIARRILGTRSRDNTIVRRLSPNNRKLDAKDDLREPLIREMLGLMGRDLAAVHLGLVDRRVAIKRDLREAQIRLARLPRSGARKNSSAASRKSGDARPAHKSYRATRSRVTSARRAAPESCMARVSSLAQVVEHVVHAVRRRARTGPTAPAARSARRARRAPAP